MTYQPSFSPETSAPVGAPDLGELGWLKSESLEGVPGLAGGEPPEPTREHPRRRVPDDDIVDVGFRPAVTIEVEPVDGRDLAFVAIKHLTQTFARKNAAAGGRLMRPLLALLILELAVSGGIYLRKRYAESQVIFVPPASSDRSVIT